MARKPFKGSLTANESIHGTGALNIDASRIGYQDDADYQRNAGFTRNPGGSMFQDGTTGQQSATSGRWPANVVLDEDMAAVLDGQSGVTSGIRKDMTCRTKAPVGAHGIYGHRTAVDTQRHGDEGGASRFFYVAKAPKKERPTYKPKVLRLREGLTQEQVDHVRAQLQAAGVSPD